MGESAWRRSGIGKDKNLFYGVFVRQPELCNARAPGLGDEGHPSDAFRVSRKEPKTSGKGENAASSSRKVKRAVHGVRCRSRARNSSREQNPGDAMLGASPGSDSDLLLSRRAFKALEGFKERWEGWESLGLGDAALGGLSSPSLPVPWPLAWWAEGQHKPCEQQVSSKESRSGSIDAFLSNGCVSGQENLTGVLTLMIH